MFKKMGKSNWKTAIVYVHVHQWVVYLFIPALCFQKYTVCTVNVVLSLSMLKYSHVATI